MAPTTEKHNDYGGNRGETTEIGTHRAEPPNTDNGFWNSPNEHSLLYLCPWPRIKQLTPLSDAFDCENKSNRIVSQTPRRNDDIITRDITRATSPATSLATSLATSIASRSHLSPHLSADIRAPRPTARPPPDNPPDPNRNGPSDHTTSS